VGIVAVLIVAAITVAVVLARRPGVGPAAPRLSPDLAPALLTRAGFPTTRHNVLAVRERLGAMFLEDVRSDVAPERWADVVAACEAGRGDMARWPQRVLDEIAAADAPAATRAARRCQDLLLASVGTGRGFLGGSLFEPLPRTAPLAAATLAAA
jgi:hypothetical protein